MTDISATTEAYNDKFNISNLLQLNTNMKTYILESIEDLHKYNATPVELLSEVYSEIVTM